MVELVKSQVLRAEQMLAPSVQEATPAPGAGMMTSVLPPQAVALAGPPGPGVSPSIFLHLSVIYPLHSASRADRFWCNTSVDSFFWRVLPGEPGRTCDLKMLCRLSWVCCSSPCMPLEASPVRKCGGMTRPSFRQRSWRSLNLSSAAAVSGTPAMHPDGTKEPGKPGVKPLVWGPFREKRTNRLAFLLGIKRRGGTCRDTARS